MLYGIQPAEIPVIWPHVAEMVEAATARARGKFWPIDVYDDCLTGAKQLWVWHSPTARAIVVTQVHTYRRKKVGSVLLCTGENSAEWAGPTLARIEEWARAHGCQQMELVARPGWKKVFPEYEQTHIFLEKEL